MVMMSDGGRTAGARLFLLGLLTLVLVSVSANSALKGPPRIEPVDPHVLLTVGQKFRLTCPIRGNPQPIYEWLKDGEDIESYWPRYADKNKNNHLRLKEVDLQDEGQYTCRAINGFGQENFTFRVVVTEEDLPPGHMQLIPPMLTVVSPASPVLVGPGEPVSLHCLAHGYPEPHILWSKEGQVLAQRGNRLDVTAPAAGMSEMYSCTGKNVVGHATANFSLVVKHRSNQPPKEELGSDLVVTGTFNTTVMLGDNTTLQCTVTTDIVPTISWLKEIPPSQSDEKNQTMDLDNRVFLIIKETRSPPSTRSSAAVVDTYFFNLHIENAQFEDQGLYGCLGANSLGYSYRKAYLNVIAERQAPAWDEELAADQKPSKTIFVVAMSAGVIIIVLVVIVIVCKLHRKSMMKSPTVTTTTIASPSPHMNKYDDPASFTALNPEKKTLPGLQYTMVAKINSKHDTISSADSTMPLPPPVLQNDITYQHDGLVYPPGRSRPLPHGPRFSDNYVYPAENSYVDSGYCDPYTEKLGPECAESGSSLDLYSDAVHIQPPNTPNPLLPPQHHSHHSDAAVHSSPSTIHTPLPNTPLLSRYPTSHPRVVNKSNDSWFNDSRSNSKRSDSRTTTATSNANSSRDVHTHLPVDQYYNSVSSSCGGEDYSNPIQNSYNSFPVNNYYRSNTNSHCNYNNLPQSSEHSYARLTPRSTSPSNQFGRSFPPISDGQSKYVVHCNL
ncbi:Immunoglobulin V-set domain [Trinorchestia longiramus]|nr:Immunoglobulin V-set domain [Trinorchestia longiramus]